MRVKHWDYLSYQNMFCDAINWFTDQIVGLEADHSPLSSAEIKKEWNYSSTVFMT